MPPIDLSSSSETSSRIRSSLVDSLLSSTSRNNINVNDLLISKVVLEERQPIRELDWVLGWVKASINEVCLSWIREAIATYDIESLKRQTNARFYQAAGFMFNGRERGICATLSHPAIAKLRFMSISYLIMPRNTSHRNKTSSTAFRNSIATNNANVSASQMQAVCLASCSSRQIASPTGPCSFSKCQNPSHC